MFSKNIKFHRGFTLMELMIVIAIIGIMSAIGFSMWQSAKSDSYLRNAQREVASAIRIAQNYALQGKTQGDVGSEFVPCFYGTSFTAIASSYEIFYKDCIGNKVSSEKFELSNGITFDSAVDVSFGVPFGDASGSIELTLRHGQDKFKTIFIENGVVIEE